MTVTRAAYSDINDDEIIAEAPITASLMKRYRDNLNSSIGSADGIGPPVVDDRRVFVPERLKSATTTAGKPIITDSSGGFTLGDSAAFLNDMQSFSGSALSFPFNAADLYGNIVIDEFLSKEGTDARIRYVGTVSYTTSLINLISTAAIEGSGDITADFIDTTLTGTFQEVNHLEGKDIRLLIRIDSGNLEFDIDNIGGGNASLRITVGNSR